jgi:hypothetical protein
VACPPPRRTFHFTPTFALARGGRDFLRQACQKAISSGGIFRSLGDLKAAISRFVEETNAEQEPFVWTADPNRVLAAVNRPKQATGSNSFTRSRVKAASSGCGGGISGARPIKPTSPRCPLMAA